MVDCNGIEAEAPPGDTHEWDLRDQAMAASLLGDGLRLLEEKALSVFERCAPLSARDQDDAATRQAMRLQGVQDSFGLAASLHPGPHQRAVMAERLQGLADWLVGLAQQGEAPRVDLLWDALEAARVGLIGAGARPPAAIWEDETFAALPALILASADREPQEGQLWPPLAHWLERTEQCMPRQPDWMACRAALAADEALVQLFFDARGGLHALWLDADGEPECRRFADPCHRDQWTNARADGVLDRWNSALRRFGQDTSSFDELAWPAFLEHPASRTLAAQLAAWFESRGTRRLVALFPAGLGQLPWEVLDAFAPERLILERAVSLGTISNNVFYVKLSI